MCVSLLCSFNHVSTLTRKQGPVDAPDCSVGTRLPHVILQSYTAGRALVSTLAGTASYALIAMIHTDVISADYITYAFETMHRQAGNKPSASSLPLEADKEVRTTSSLGTCIAVPQTTPQYRENGCSMGFSASSSVIISSVLCANCFLLSLSRKDYAPCSQRRTQ